MPIKLFSIHVLNVGLGDSIILETVIEGESFYSIIDCKRVGTKTPVVEFLKKRKIKNLHSLFITHFHSDHCSGLPHLRDYLKDVKGTLEFYISPTIPGELELYERLLKELWGKKSQPSRKSILRAINDIKELPSRNDANGKAQSIRILFDGDITSNAWRTHIHPGLLFAPVHPNPTEAIHYLTSVIKKAELEGKSINSLSHGFMIQFSDNPHNSIALFTGDLEGTAWRTVKNRCNSITNNLSRTNINFVKVPHHGGRNLTMESCLQELINSDTPFVASISCPPGSAKHPCGELLEFLKGTFSKCHIACTNTTGYCHDKGFSLKVEPIFSRTAKEEEFLDFVMSDKQTSLQAVHPGPCAGSHIFTVTDTGFELSRSSGSPCGFHQTNDRVSF